MSGSNFWQLALLALSGVGVGLWWSGSRARELAIAHALAACRRESVQLLDDTVALTRVRLIRSSRGSLVLQRRYRFEFTSEGEFRDTADITLRGHEICGIRFPYRRDACGNRIFQH